MKKIGFIKQTQVVYLNEKSRKMLLEEFEMYLLLSNQLIRSIRGGGEICETIILSFNGEIVERVKTV